MESSHNYGNAILIGRRTSGNEMIALYLTAMLIAGGIYALLRHLRPAVRIGIAIASFALLASAATFLIYLVGDTCSDCEVYQPNQLEA